MRVNLKTKSTSDVTQLDVKPENTVKDIKVSEACKNTFTLHEFKHTLISGLFGTVSFAVIQKLAGALFAVMLH